MREKSIDQSVLNNESNMGRSRLRKGKKGTVSKLSQYETNL
jgi:hypothetical protein